ncbi:MAG TPA: FlgO family outer membrane protein, partial [Spirochaetota bacterium]|nr:FlgO family outer membrane protein [Spirochaetota bacterium]
MRKYVLLLICFLFTVPAAARAADTRILVAPFYGESADEVTSFMKSLSDKTPAQTSFLDPAVKAPELPADGINSTELVNELSKIGNSQNAEYVLTGIVSRAEDVFSVNAILVHTTDSKVTYSTKLFSYKSDLKYNPAPDLWGRVQFALDGKSFPVNNLKVGQGASANEIAVEWEAVPDCAEYLVYRGKKMDGAFELAAKTKRPALYDTKSEIGVKIFYYVQPVMNGIRCDQSAPVAGYRKPAIPKGEDLRKMLSTFNKP